MLFKKNLDSFVERWYKKFSEINTVSKKFCKDLRELFTYGSESMDRLIYQSNGIVGICNDFTVYKNSLSNRFSFMRETTKNLENILFPKKHIDEDLSLVKLNKIIEIKNKYFWKNTTQLQDIIKDNINTNVDVDSILKETMLLKTSNHYYENLSRINYDSRLAPKNMKEEIISSYIYSNKTLKELSKDLEIKYGMHISVSTLSVNARKYLSNNGLDFKNRREARKYYEIISTFE